MRLNQDDTRQLEGDEMPTEEERDITWLFLPAGERTGKTLEHPGPPAPRSGQRAAGKRAERLELMFQKSEKRDVVHACPASRVQIIHGELQESGGKNPGLVIRRSVCDLG